MRRISPRSPWQRFAVMVGAVLALVGGYYWGNRYRVDPHPPLQNLSAVLLRDAAPLADITLVDQFGQDFTSIDFKDHWNLLLFGCTHCAPTSTALVHLTRVRNRLADQPILQRTTRILLVALDPERDTISEMATYLHGFGAGFFGLTGTESQIQELSQKLGALKPQYDLDDPAVALIAPTGAPIALFPSGLDANVVASDLKRLAEYHEY